MNFLAYDIVWLLLFIFTINFISLAFVRSDERFWMPSTLFWILLICSMFINLSLNKNNVIEKEAVYNAQTDPGSKANEGAAIGLEEAIKQQNQENTILLRLTGFQTFLCLLCQLLGFHLTSQKQFRKGAVAFFIFLLLYGLIEMIRLFF
jgi:hypothetical protein